MWGSTSKAPLGRRVSLNSEGRVSESLGAQAYQSIKADIVWCRLDPGEEVSEARLCELYGLGKAPIRQALLRLTQEGYIIPQARRGHIVSPVTLRYVRELFDWRQIVEPATSELACGRVDEAKLRQLDQRCAEGYIPGNIEAEARFIAANDAFHLEIAAASGNSRLINSMRQILDEMTRLLHLGYVLRERPAESRREHSELIDALVRSDVAAARAITSEHIRSVQSLVMDGLTQFSSLRNLNIARA